MCVSRPWPLAPERLTDFSTASGTPVAPLYTAEDIADIADERDIGEPGAPPVHPRRRDGSVEHSLDDSAVRRFLYAGRDQSAVS